MRISTEQDQLMWILAEEGDVRAVEEFESRHPELKYELSRRISMVRQLKGEGRRIHRHSTVPRFQPVSDRRSVAPRRLAIAVGALSLAAIAAATFAVVTFMTPQRPVVRAAPNPPVVERVPEQIQESPVRQEPTISAIETPEPRREPQTQIEETPRYLAPQDLKIDRAPLLSALKLIATQGGLKLEVAPGMPNPDIKIAYQGITPVEMLQDLGRQYAFTAFDQGGDTILIIPAVDPNQAAVEADPAKAKATPYKAQVQAKDRTDE